MYKIVVWSIAKNKWLVVSKHTDKNEAAEAWHRMNNNGVTPRMVKDNSL